MLRALILDMDGTLCESEEVHRAAFNRAFAEAGLGWTWDRELYGRLLAVKGGVDRIVHYMETEADPTPSGDLTARARTLHGRKTVHFKTLVTGGVPPRPGVLRLMGEARTQGVRLALVTSATAPTAAALVEGVLGPDGMGGFETVCTGDQVQQNKPAPDLYRLALRRLALPPGECVAVEDDPPGLRAARAAGVAVVITPSAYDRGEEFPGALSVLSHLGAPDDPCAALGGPAPPGGIATVAWLAGLLEASGG